jgi:hypothetical protein
MGDFYIKIDGPSHKMIYIFQMKQNNTMEVL